MNINNDEQALVEDWISIDYAPDLPMANYAGLCPNCQKKYGIWLTRNELNEY